MTPRSFFSIFIKITGICILLLSITIIPQFIATLFFFEIDEFGIQDILLIVGVPILAMLALFFVLYYCIFKTDTIIDKLQLDKNFKEEKFELNIHRSTILTIAVIVIGGIVLIDTLPNLCKFIFSYMQQRSMRFMDNPNGNWLIFYAIKSLIGLFMVTNSRLIINFIELKRKK